MFGMPMGGVGPMGMMGFMGPLMPLMLMMQMMQMMQMLQMMLGQQQGGNCGCGFNPYSGMAPALDAGFNFPSSRPHYSPPYVPWSGGHCPSPEAAYGAQPWNAATGNRLADIAASMNGVHFKPGQTCRCADFVSTMIERAGLAPPGFRHEVSCDRLQRYGRPVDRGDLKPGDVVYFGNTWRPGRYTHVGIYLGNGRFAHRPTANRPVRIDSLDRGYYASKYTGARRLGT